MLILGALERGATGVRDLVVGERVARQVGGHLCVEREGRVAGALGRGGDGGGGGKVREGEAAGGQGGGEAGGAAARAGVGGVGGVGGGGAAARGQEVAEEGADEQLVDAGDGRGGLRPRQHAVAVDIYV